ncbi:hypothetical protein MMON_03750 [Mycolicibacterium monacense]|uniref:Uncharacterized protein n=1 Tax=Mycolicibacterium monacense TaxID=85693 RepID=A0AAD1IQP0_MYCMB|nr:hypothetical protein MMON_03750 [Mycolicibacterium monacense]
MFGFELRQAGQQLIESAKRTALVSRDEGSDVASLAGVPFVLLHHQSSDRLNSGQQNRTRGRPVPRVEVTVRPG